MKLNEIKKIRRLGPLSTAQEIVKLLDLSSPVMITLIGLPASGKSTFRETLQSEMEKAGKEGFVIASTDDMIDDAAKALKMTYSQAYVTLDRNAIEKKFKKIIDDAVKDEKSYLIDRTNMSVKNRRPHLVNTSKSFTKVAVVFEIDPKVQAQRLKVRAEKTGKHIPDDVINSMRKDYQPPTYDEGFDEIFFVS